MNNVAPYFNTHTHHQHNTSPAIRNIDITEIHTPDGLSDNNYHSIGMHPWNAEMELWTNRKSLMEKILLNNTVLAIGETGLDKLQGDFNAQKSIFIDHITLSEDYAKPLIIHCVRAYNELLGIKKKLRPKQQWIIHGFNNKQEIAQQLWGEGCILSFGAALFSVNSSVSETLAQAQHGTFFLENDDNPVHIEQIYERAALLRNVPINDLRNTLWKQAQTVFFE